MITVIGYGALMDKSSALITVPGLKNYRKVLIPNYIRIFNKVGIYFFEKYHANEYGNKIASCATRYKPGIGIWAVAFEVNNKEFLELYERENRFRWVSVEFDYHNKKGLGRMCTEYNDEDYRLNKCVTDEEYHRHVGRYYSGKIWRTDILPFPIYLKHCINYARSHGKVFYENYLTTTFLADGKTSLDDALKLYPEYLDGCSAPYKGPNKK